MAVQVTPYNPVSLTDLALNKRNFNAQQEQQSVVNEQNNRRLKLSEAQIDAAAKKAGMDEQRYRGELLADIVSKTSSPQEAMSYASGIGLNVPEEAFSVFPETVYGSGRPSQVINRDDRLDGLTPEQVQQAKLIESGLAPRAGTEVAPKVQVIGGVPYVFDSSTKTMTPVEVGGETVTPEVVAANKGTVAAGEAAGKDAIQASKDARESLKNVDSTIANIGDAIQALDDGATTGAIASRLPSVRTASIELENAQRRLGLNIIGATTFGALSKGELDLALQTAVPTGLGPQELRNWLVNKRDAQEKLSTELENAAIFLGTPGNTVAEYMEIMRGNGGFVEGGASPVNTQPSQSAPLDRTSLEAEARRRGLIQ